jgi:oligopeptide/dipeptide ABC transporter ATP-binding protein
METDLHAETDLLRISGLKTWFGSVVRAVDGVDLSVAAGETVCVVGESGCGKSILARSILNIVPPPGRITEGKIGFRQADGQFTDIAQLSPSGEEIRAIRGKEIAMIFQEPMTSLGPVQTIGSQIGDAIRLHFKVSKAEARSRTIRILSMVGMPRPEERIDAYAFQLSGGMRQRAMIALALSCMPRLLIADEPTTALDVTTQAVILDLIRNLQEELGMAVMFITHDLGVVAEIADSVAVMYLGRVVERAGVDELFHAPKHPYTKGLLRSIPRLGIAVGEELETIEGSVPNPLDRPSGCSFHPRCPSFMPGICDRIDPPRTRLANGTEVRCHLYADADAGLPTLEETAR